MSGHKMKAIRIHKHCGADVLQMEEVPKPAIGPDEVLVRMKATSINPADDKIRAGEAPSWLSRVPRILGWDVSGIVVEVGANVHHFKQNDEVYAFSELARDGSNAEFIAVKGSILAHKPKNLSFEEAAAAPLVLLTAYQALFEKAHVQSGHKVSFSFRKCSIFNLFCRY